MAVVSYHYQNRQSPLKVDVKRPVTVKCQNKSGTDTSAQEFKKNDECFYKSEDGIYCEAIIHDVDMISNPRSYTVKILSHLRETPVERLYREIPNTYSEPNTTYVHIGNGRRYDLLGNDDIQKTDQQRRDSPLNILKRDTAHSRDVNQYNITLIPQKIPQKNPNDVVVAENGNPVGRSTQELENQMQDKPLKSPERGPVRGELSSEGRQTGWWPEGEWHPTYPKEEFSCMSLKIL
jgi:hypothetical protein